MNDRLQNRSLVNIQKHDFQHETNATHFTDRFTKTVLQLSGIFREFTILGLVSVITEAKSQYGRLRRGEIFVIQKQEWAN